MSVAWRDSITITVEVAFASAPLAESPSYTDISQYVRSFRTSRGRSSEFDTYSVGTAQIVLDNRTRIFDPEYSSGSYYGNLVPMKRVRVSAAVGVAAAVVIYTGHVLGWPQQYTNPRDATVTVTAVDGSRFLENAPLAASAYAGEVMLDDPFAYYPLQSAGAQALPRVGTVPLDESIVQFSYSAATTDDLEVPVGESSAFAPTENPDSAGTWTAQYKSVYDTAIAATMAPPKSVEFWFNGGTQTQVWFGYDTYDYLIVTASAEYGIYIDYSNNSDDNSWIAGVDGLPGVMFEQDRTYHVAVRATSTDIYLYLDGAEVWTEAIVSAKNSVLSAGELVAFSLSGETARLSHGAAYATAPSAARILEHYNTGSHAYGHPMGERSGARIGRVLDQIEWPDALRNLDTGDTVHGPYLPDSQSALSYLRSVESAEQGYVFLDAQGRVTLIDRQAIWDGDTTPVVFSDDGSDVPYMDVTVDGNTVDAVRNIIAVQFAGGEVFAKDASSIGSYGHAAESVDASTVDNASNALSLAAYRLRQAKDPTTRVTRLVIPPRKNSSVLFPIILALELGDRATVERLPQGVGSRFSKNVVVQGIDHDVDPANWITTLYLSPGIEDYTQAPYLTLGDATYGKIGTVAGNLIPF